MRRELPTWFDDAKLGIFVHWTAGSVPAFAPTGTTLHDVESMGELPYAEWYQNGMAVEGSSTARHHAERYGDAPYDDFVRTFRDSVEAWDPEPLADLCAAAGARYVVQVTKHHDGFLLWPSDLPNPHRDDWQPRRDAVGDFAAAVRARGLRWGAYYSGGLDWTFGGLPIVTMKDAFEGVPQSPEYLAYANGHWQELVQRYRPSVLWNDIGYPKGADLDGLFERYYERVPDGVVNNRFDVFAQTAGATHADFLTPEYTTTGSAARKWESCRGVGHSFAYNAEEGPDDHLSTDDLVRMLVDVVANGGNLLLNIGPTGAGAIPWLQAEPILGLGWWLRANGEAIYGTRPWTRPAGTTTDGLDVRYTAGPAADAVYAVVLGTPAGRELTLDVDLAPGATAHLLGSNLPVAVTPDALAGTTLTLPEVPPAGPALALRLSPAAAVS